MEYETERYLDIECEWQDGSISEHKIVLFKHEVNELGVEDAIVKTIERITGSLPVAYSYVKGE